MASRVTRVLTFVTILWLCVRLPRSIALSVKDLYPFGPALSNSVLPQDIDVSSPEVPLETEIKYFDESYKSIFVNSNGVLSFLVRFPEFANIEFPLMYPMIAPFYSYIDTRQAGAIYYYETKDEKVLRRATDIVKQSFSSAYDFQAKSVFIATWDNVGYNPNGADKQNTFQVAISSDGNSSYVEFLYPDNGIQWVQGTSKKDALPDARAQVGIIARDGRMHVVHGSGNDQVRNIVRRTNCGAPGHWLFRVGPLSYGTVEEPDVNRPALPWQETCDKDSSICHSSAHCAPAPFGDSCCECDRGQIGNGLSCIPEAAPLRVTGSVTGKLNNINITDVDIQTYAMINDGRIYTALTRVPSELGNELELITAFVNSVGWLFGKRDAEAANGFSLTGGVLNHTCDIFFPRSDHRVTIMIKYTGLDIFDQLALNVKIIGEVPSLGPVQELVFPDHDEVFLEEIPGVLQSSSRQMFHVKHGEPEIPFTVEQRIEFDVCGKRSVLGLPHPGSPATLRLECTQTTVLYEPQDELLRFSAVYKTFSKLASTDPCAKAVCGPHSVCVSSDIDFECQCLPGYTIHQGEEECSDVNECERSRSVCSPLANCENTLGSYRCTCPHGYSGDGTICEKDYICEDTHCQEYATCVNNQCQCITGYIALGLVCVLNETGVTQNRNPGEYSMCALDPISNVEECVCVPGYTGDGYDCYPLPIDEAGGPPQTPDIDPYRGTCYEYQDCHPDATCDYSSQTGNYACKCKEGFTGDGRLECKPDRRGCNVLHDCHRDAECVSVNIYTRKFECQCRYGFVGDGKQSCIRNAPLDCSELRNCGYNAECIHVHGAQGYSCTCKEGYVGDGFSCKPERRHEKTRCGPHGMRQCKESESDFLLVNQGVATLKVPLLPGIGVQGIPIHIGAFKVAIGIDVDCMEQRVYWGDVLGNAIKSSYYNGTNETTFLNIDIGSPEGVSVDWVSRNIYWTDSVKKRIEVASLDNKERKILADYGLENPRGIAVHPLRGKLFWSDWNRVTPKLEWANLDGTQREVFLQGEAVVLPNSLAIDFERDELCWADAGTKSIECINLEHSERRTVATNCSHPFGLTLSPDNYFWTDWASSKIDSASRPEGIRNKPREISMGSGKMYGLVVVPRECSRHIQNACYWHRGGCDSNQLCLPSGPSNRRCVCGQRGPNQPPKQDGEQCRDDD